MNRVTRISLLVFLAAAGLVAWWGLREPGRDSAGGASGPSPHPATAAVTSAVPVAGSTVPVPESLAGFAAWLDRYRQASPSARSALAAEGVLLAQARRGALKALIQRDPEAALALAVSYEDRRLLPAGVAALLEQPVSGGGSYTVAIACGMDEGPAGHAASDVERMLELGPRTYRVFTYGDRLGTTTKRGLSAQGIAIDDCLALHTNPVRRLSPAEAADRGVAPVATAVEMAGRLRVVPDDAAVAHWTAALMADEHRLGPEAGRAYEAAASGAPLAPAPADGANTAGVSEGPAGPGTQSTWTEGAKTMLYIRARFSDEAVGFEPVSLATASNNQAVVDSYWRMASYGKMSLSTVFTDVVPLPTNAAAYTSAFSSLLSAATAAAKAANPAWDSASFSLYVVVTSPGSFSYAGKAYVGSSGAHLRSDYTTLRTAGHEFGHNLGLWHANYWRTDSTSPVGRDSVPGGYVSDGVTHEWIEYGHRFSLMSAQSGTDFDTAAKPHYSVIEKTRLDWLATTNGVVTLAATPATGTVIRIYRQDHPAATGTRAVKLDVPSSDYTTTSAASKRRYWLSYRRAFNSGTPASYAPYGVDVDWTQPSYGSYGAVQIDMTPYTRDVTTYMDATNLPGSYWTVDNTDKEDAMQPVGLTYTDPAGISFTPLAFGDDDGVATNGNEWIDVDIRLGAATNLAPSVTLAASTNSPGINSNVTFTATAADPDGDDLSYWWDFGDNSVVTSSFNKASAAKSWSTAGGRVVRVVVSDRRGGQASALVPVMVGSSTNAFEIRGRVLQGGVPVSGARVGIGTSYQCWSDTQGHYVLPGLPAGGHTLACRKEGLTFTAQFTNPVATTAGSQYGKDFYANEASGTTGTATLVISPDEAWVPSGGSLTFGADAFDALGNAATVTPVFAVSGGGTINASNGVFVAATQGVFAVTVAAGSLAATGTVTVTAPLAFPVITNQPVSRSVDEGATATFSVGASGSAPLTYRWRRSGVALVATGRVANVTSATMSLSGALPADAGTYDCLVSNLAGSVVSTAAVLSVNARPVIALTRPLLPAVNIPSGVGLALVGGVTDDGLPAVPGVVTCLWSQASGPGTVVWGTRTNATTTASFPSNGTYVLRLSAYDGGPAAVRDVAVFVGSPLAITPGSGITREWYTNITGSAVSNLTGSSKFTNGQPDLVVATNIFEAPVNVADNYGTRMRGFFVAPQNGAYTFAIASDDNSELWLSTNVLASNKVKVAWVTGSTSSREWTKYASQTSTPVVLSAGSAYYIEALQKEGSGSDNLAVGVTLPDATVERPIPGTRLAVYIDPAGNCGPTVGAALAGLPLGFDAVVNGSVADDGLPVPPGAVTSVWQAISGPGTASFGNVALADTTVTFGSAGAYGLRLTADDGQVRTFRDLPVSIDGVTFAVWMTNYPALTGTNAVNTADPDGDGVSNGDEYLAGTNPTNAASVLRIDRVAPGSVRFVSGTGRSYEIQVRADWGGSGWLSLTGGVVGSGGPLSVGDPASGGLTQRFYRVRVEP